MTGPSEGTGVFPMSESIGVTTDRVRGDYRFVRRIGAGAMAEVWLATQRSLNRPVAVKILRPDLACQESYRKRFMQEAQAAARLEHPNIVRVYEVGTLAGASGFTNHVFSLLGLFPREKNAPLHYIAEEYVAGANLQHRLRRLGRTPPREAVGILRQVGEALRAAAIAGIVHRDIKPENILVADTGVVKVADFGLAFLLSEEPTDALALTRVGVTLGTPLYMSPEQAAGRPLDARSDLYSLGATAYQMLTGRPPFMAETPVGVLMAHLNCEPVPLGELAPETPPALAELVHRMLAKNPNERLASAEEFLVALTRVRGGLSSGSFSCDKVEHSPVGCDEEDRLLLSGPMKGLAVANELQTSFAEKAAVGAATRLLPKNFRARRFFGIFAAVGLFLLGGVMGWWGVYDVFFGRNSSSPEISRFDTVEEQMVFAMQVGSAAAWRSVSENFPHAGEWTEKAARQYAYALMIEGRIAEAHRAFDRFVELPPTERAARIFGLAGRAWCLAAEGHLDEAQALLSDLRRTPAGSYDRLTESVLSKTAELIRLRTRPLAEEP